MHNVLAALGLAVAIPVALATPALAKSPDSVTPSISSVLRQHEGFRAEVTYRCTGTKHQEGTIKVLLQQAGMTGVTNVVPAVATAYEEADCDGKEREVTIKIPVAAGAVQAGDAVQLNTTLVVNGKQVAEHRSPAEPVTGYSEPTPTPSPSVTESESPEIETPSPSPSVSESESPEIETPSPSPSVSESESPEIETPSPSPSVSESESPEIETPSPSPSSTP